VGEASSMSFVKRALRDCFSVDTSLLQQGEEDYKLK
jgi:hypothetical protein